MIPSSHCDSFLILALTMNAGLATDKATTKSTDPTVKVSPESSGSRRVTKASNRKKSPSLPPETVEYLKQWIMSPDHISHPYPTEQEKIKIMDDTGIELKQLTNWFVNNRKRFWKPRVEARLRQQKPSGRSSKASSGKKNTFSVNTNQGEGSTEVKTRVGQLTDIAPKPDGRWASSSAQVSVASDDANSDDNMSTAFSGDDSAKTSDAEMEPFKSGNGVLTSYLSYLSERKRRRIVSPLRSKRRKGAITGVGTLPRPIFGCENVELWKEVCQQAKHNYDTNLPSLGEATTLFGFTNAST